MKKEFFLLDEMADEIILVDEQLRISYANRAFLGRTGKTMKEILGKKCYEMVHSEVCRPPSHPCPSKEVFEKKTSSRVVHTHKDKKGNQIFVEIMASPVREGGKIVSAIEVMRDITPNKKMEEELIQRNRELAIINDMAFIMNRPEKLGSILERSIEEISKILGMDAGCILLKEDEEREGGTIFYGLSLGFVEKMGKGKRILAEGITGKNIMVIKDIMEDSRIADKELLEKEGLASLVCVPLVTGEKYIGLLVFMSRKRINWTENKERLLFSCANFLGNAIQRIKYMNQIEIFSEKLGRIVEQKSKRISALLEAHYTLEHTSSWQIGLKTILESITGGLGFDNAYLFLINERKNVLRCEAFLSSYQDVSDIEIPLDDDGYASVQSIRQKKPINIQDAFTDPRAKKQVGDKIKAFAWIPIIFKNEILGAFSVDNRGSGISITDEDIETLVLFANSVAAFIDKTRMFFIPTSEKALSGKTKYGLIKSEGYIVFEEKPDKAFDIFLDAVNHDFQGFCITRTYPAKIRKKYPLAKTPILWLSGAQTQESINPTDLGKLVHIITEFLHKAENSIIFVEGIEYLITENDFLKVMKALHSLQDEINISGSHLLVSLNPKTLTDKEMGIIKKEFIVI